MRHGILVGLLILAGTAFAGSFAIGRLTGDFNGDGAVDFIDFLVFATNFGQTGGTTFDLQLSELQQGDTIVAPIVLSGVDTGVSHLSMIVRLSHPDVAEIVVA